VIEYLVANPAPPFLGRDNVPVLWTADKRADMAVSTRLTPLADVGRFAIPQRGSLLLWVSVLSFLVGSSGGIG
jgi:hypothetical protein